MDEWYEVVKYEYDFWAFPLPKLYIVVKKKVEDAPLRFGIKWFDADGVIVGGSGSHFNELLVTRNTPVGEAIRVFAYAPHERDMSKVKSIVVTRELD